MLGVEVTVSVTRIQRRAPIATGVMISLLLGCSSGSETDPTPEPIATDQNALVFASRARLGPMLIEFEAEVTALRDAAPAPDADGWSDPEEATAVVAMREHWRRARVIYHRMWAAAAILMPDQEAAIERLYDVHLNEGDGEFEGMHAVERVLWADAIPAEVAEREAMLPDSEAARFPTDEASARAFREDLCGDLIELAGEMRTRFADHSLEPQLAVFGLQKTVEKLLKKLSPPLGLYDSRYAQHTLVEMRANVTGIGEAWLVYGPLVDSVDPAASQAVVDGLARLEPVRAAPAVLPAVPAGWNPSIVDSPPGSGDYSTLWSQLAAEVAPETGTLSWGLGRAVAIVAALEPQPAPDGIELVGGDPGFPTVPDVGEAWNTVFDRGQREFDATFTEADGLGPVYIEASCSTCHFDNAAETRIAVRKMTLMDADGPAADQSALLYGRTIRERLAGGGTTPVAPPAGADVLIAERASPGLFGRGYMEAVDPEEIQRLEIEQSERSDGISGRIHRVGWHSEANPTTPFHDYQPGDSGLIGRFGLKAQIATVDDFVAVAYLTDMSITTPLRPNELPNPDGLTDDAQPGVDLPLDRLNDVADWTRLIAIPLRPSADPRGAGLFQQVSCAVCHVPSLRTRADYPIAAMADVDAHLYTDLLLHDMGDELSDGVAEGDAAPTEWRTAPLLGLARMPSWLHDGRASSIDEAIRLHGGEAAASVAAYLALSDEDRAALLDFVSSL